jgi:hypothetical protein
MRKNYISDRLEGIQQTRMEWTIAQLMTVTVKDVLE